MADLTERISVLIDSETTKATSALGDFKSKLGDAEGATGKLGAAAKGAGDLLSAMPLPAVAGAAAGAVAAVIGLGNGFEDAALNAKKLSDATGLSVQDASRWQEVAGDVGVSAETLEGAFGKATKAIGATPEKFEALGVSIAHTKDGTIDMNATFLNAIGTINSIEDPTKKAALASQLFGKSWADLTPVLSEGTDQIRQNLAAVSDAKVITDGEVESAKKWQATMDTLGDTLDDLKLTAGKLVVDGLGPTLEVLSEFAGQADDLINSVDELAGPLGGVGQLFADWFKYLSPLGLSMQALTLFTNEFTAAVNALEGPFKSVAGWIGDGVGVVKDLGSALAGGVGDVEGFISSIGGAGVEIQKFDGFITDTHNDLGKHKDATDEAGLSIASYGSSLRAAGVEEDDLSTITAGTTAVTEDQTKAINDAKTALDAQKQSLDDLAASMEKQQNAALGTLGAEINLRQSVTSVGDALQQQGATSDDTALKILAAAGDAGTLAQKQAEAAGATFTAADNIAAQRQELEALRGKFPQLSGVIDGFIGKLDGIPVSKEVEVRAHAEGLDAIIDRLNSIHDKTIHINAVGGVNVNGTEAGGGPINMSGLYLVGEKGRELVQLPGGKWGMLGASGQELVNLPTGAYVYPADETKRMLGGSVTPLAAMVDGGLVGGVGVGPNDYRAPAGTVITVNVNAGLGANGKDIGDAVVGVLTQYCRRNGSLPQQIKITG